MSLHSTNIYGQEYIIIKFYIWSITRSSVIKFSSNLKYGLPLKFSGLARRLLRSNSIYVYNFYSAGQAGRPDIRSLGKYYMTRTTDTERLNSQTFVAQIQIPIQSKKHA